MKQFEAAPDGAAHVFERHGVVVVRGAIAPLLCSWTHDYLTAALDTADDPQGHFPLAVRLSEELRYVPYHLAGRRTFLHDILGERLFMHLPPMARFVRPGNMAAAVPPHDDASYNHHLTNFVTLWVPLVPIDGECGGMAVYPDSINHKNIPSGEVRNGWLPAMDVTGLERVELQPLSPGDVVVMHPWLVHESMPNNSDHVRLSLDYRFFGSRGRSTKHYLDLQTNDVIAPEPAHA